MPHGFFDQRRQFSGLAGWTASVGLTAAAFLGAGLFGQPPIPPMPANPGFQPVESTYVWLAFFQDHNRLLDNAKKRAAGNPGLLPVEQERVGRRFGLSASAHAKVIPQTASFHQNFAPLAAQQRANREAIQAHKQAASRQQYMNFLLQREKMVLDAVAVLRRSMTPKDFQQLRQRIYSDYSAQRAQPAR